MGCICSERLDALRERGNPDPPLVPAILTLHHQHSILAQLVPERRRRRCHPVQVPALDVRLLDQELKKLFAVLDRQYLQLLQPGGVILEAEMGQHRRPPLEGPKSAKKPSSHLSVPLKHVLL